MTCTQCRLAYALATPVTDKAGNERFMCVSCAAAQASTPRRFPEGTQPSPRMPARNDFVDDERGGMARALEIRTAQAGALAAMLQAVLSAFPELRTGLSSAEQQAVLREARALLAEVGL